MDLRVLMSFVTVCRLGNITRAAEALYISQPALTRQIQELEQELGCKLLIRSTRSLSLTENGYLFLLRAQEILDLAKQAKAELSENGDVVHGVVRVGIVESRIMITLPTQLFNSTKGTPAFNLKSILLTATT